MKKSWKIGALLVLGGLVLAFGAFIFKQRIRGEITHWGNYTVEIIPPRNGTAINRLVDRYRAYLPPKLCELLYNDEFPWEQTIELSCDDKSVWQTQSFSFSIEPLTKSAEPGAQSPLAFGLDLFGTGKPNLIIREESGGNRCCTTFHIFELTPIFTEIVTVETEYGWFADDDADGVYELHSLTRFEGSFSGAATPGATSIRRWDGQDFVPAPHLMVKPLTAFTNYADVLIDGHGEEEVSNDDYAPLFQTVLDLLFSGNISTAWELLDQARTGTKAPSQEMVEYFLAHLEGDADWQAMNNWINQ